MNVIAQVVLFTAGLGSRGIAIGAATSYALFALSINLVAFVMMRTTD